MFGHVQQQQPTKISAMHDELSNTRESQAVILSKFDNNIERQAATKSTVTFSSVKPRVAPLTGSSTMRTKGKNG